MADDLNITGGKALDDFLKSLPGKVEKNIMRSALRQGANEFKDEVKATVPVGPPSFENRQLYGAYPGALRDTVRVTTKSKGGKVSASVKIGGKNKKGHVVFYAHMVEFGTKPHKITSKKGYLSINGRVVKAINHPGTAPQPFMRPAFDAKATAAIAAVGAQIRKRLTAEGINVPAPETD